MTPLQITKFLQGGKAIFTLKSLKTDKHYTFKAVCSKEHNLLWIYVLTDGDKYVYLGTVYMPVYQHDWIYKITLKSTNSPLHKVMAWFINQLNHCNIHPQLEFKYAGKCSRCGRTLTTPESIDSGIGPVCSGKIGEMI